MGAAVRADRPLVTESAGERQRLKRYAAAEMRVRSATAVGEQDERGPGMRRAPRARRGGLERSRPGAPRQPTLRPGAHDGRWGRRAGRPRTALGDGRAQHPRRIRRRAPRATPAFAVQPARGGRGSPRRRARRARSASSAPAEPPVGAAPRIHGSPWPNIRRSSHVGIRDIPRPGRRRSPAQGDRAHPFGRGKARARGIGRAPHRARDTAARRGSEPGHARARAAGAARAGRGEPGSPGGSRTPGRSSPSRLEALERRLADLEDAIRAKSKPKAED